MADNGTEKQLGRNWKKGGQIMELKFTGLPGKAKETQKEVEKLRFMEAQINGLESKIEELEKVITIGAPLAEVKGGIERLERLDREFEVHKSNTMLLISNMKKLSAIMDGLVANMEKRPSGEKLEHLTNRFEKLEKSLAELSKVEKVKNISELLETNKALAQRVSNLERMLEKDVRVSMSESAEGEKTLVTPPKKSKTVRELFGMPVQEQKTMRFAAKGSVSAATEDVSKSINDLLRDLVKKKI